MSDFFRDVDSPVARKAHRCIVCYATIPVGEQYKAQSGVWDGRAFRNKFHNECFDALCADSDYGPEFSPGSGEPPERLLKPA